MMFLDKAGNKKMCGQPLEEECEISHDTQDFNVIGDAPPAFDTIPDTQPKVPHKKPPVISIVIVAIFVLVALIAIGAVIVILRRRNQEPEESVEAAPATIVKKAAVSCELGRTEDDTQSVNGRKSDIPKLSFVRDDKGDFDLGDLLKASAEILGSGCFGSSYKAVLPSGSMMVVKRFKQMNNVSKDEFQEHMRRLGRLSHPNLLPLVAYYYRKEEKLLVADFVDRGSLTLLLHGKPLLL